MLSYEDLKCNFREFSYTHTKTAPASFKVFACRTREGVHEYNHVASAARSLRRPRRAPRLLVSGRTRSTSTSPCAATTRLRPHALYVDLAVRRDYSSPAARALRRPRRAPRLLVSTLSWLQRSTSPPPRVRVPRHVARLATRLVASLVVDYSASRRLVIDYFAYAARPGASARRAARHTAHRRLLRAPRLRLAATLALLQPRRAL
jgi:hypothetical protein